MISTNLWQVHYLFATFSLLWLCSLSIYFSYFWILLSGYDRFPFVFVPFIPLFFPFFPFFQQWVLLKMELLPTAWNFLIRSLWTSNAYISESGGEKVSFQVIDLILFEYLDIYYRWVMIWTNLHPAQYSRQALQRSLLVFTPEGIPYRLGTMTPFAFKDLNPGASPMWDVLGENGCQKAAKSSFDLELLNALHCLDSICMLRGSVIRPKLMSHCAFNVLYFAMKPVCSKLKRLDSVNRQTHPQPLSRNMHAFWILR